MVEIAVAMIVLGILLVAFLPLAVSSIELAAKNTAIAQANQLVSSELDTQRASMSGLPCDPTDSAEPFTVADSRFSATREVSCDGALATLTIVVKSTEYGGETFAHATTKILTS